MRSSHSLAPWGFGLLMIAGLASASCSESEQASVPDEPGGAADASTQSAAGKYGANHRTGSRDMPDILVLVKGEQFDRAVAMLLDLVNRDAPPEAYRPADISEKELVRRDDWQKLADWLLEEYLLVRDLARDVDRRIEQAMHAGDLARARTLINALERLGSANTGPEDEITKLGNLVGEAVQRMADKRRKQLQVLSP